MHFYYRLFSPRWQFSFKIFKGSSSLVKEMISGVKLRITKWALIRKEFSNLNINDLLIIGHAWSLVLLRREEVFHGPLPWLLKFKADGAARGP